MNSNIPNTKSHLIRSVELNNVRTFGKKQTLKFTDEEGIPYNWNLIIGDNGSGKTTVLKSIACLLYLNENFQSRFRKVVDADEFTRDDNVASIKIETQTNNEDNFHFEFEINKQEIIYKNDSDNSRFAVVNLIGFGANRKIGKKGFSEEMEFPAHNLFEETSTLLNAEEWLLQADYRTQRSQDSSFNEFDKIANILKNLFKSEISDIQIKDEPTPRVYFETKYGWVKLHQLSLGYRTLISWIIDLARWITEFYPESDEPLKERAVCLIDEIDLHLHPKFQRELIEFLSKVFPNVQFIASAHSPLIVQTFSHSNIIVLKRSGDHVLVKNNLRDVSQYRIDQILTSDLFGISGTRNKETEKKINRRRNLLEKGDELSSREAEELFLLEQELDSVSSQESPELIKAMKIIKEAANEINK